MKKILFTILGLVAVATASQAQVNITKVDRIDPTDGVYMDMATEAAKTSLGEGGAASGAVIILNNAFHSSGKGTEAEMNALGKARVKSLANATLYTINEPTPEVIVTYSERGVSKIYFVNPKEAVIVAGIHSEADYAPVEVPEDLTLSPVTQLTYDPAAKLISK